MVDLYDKRAREGYGVAHITAPAADPHSGFSQWYSLISSVYVSEDARVVSWWLVSSVIGMARAWTKVIYDDR